MPDAGSGSLRVLIWVTEETWRAAVDAALRIGPPASAVTLLHVTPDEPPEVAHAAYLGLFGRGAGRDPRPRIAGISASSAAELLDAAEQRLGRPCQRIMRAGRPEREVVAEAARADLVIMARDGDRSRLGPKSLGKATRFAVDHAPCPVLLVWPEPAPTVETIPDPPPPPPGAPPGPPPPGGGRAPG